MSKMLNLGMSLKDVVKASTLEPARALGLSPEIGTLAIGSPADIAVFSLEEGQFIFYDVNGQSRAGRQFLQNEITMVAGRELRPQLDEPPVPWISGPKNANGGAGTYLRKSRSQEGIQPTDFPTRT